MYCPPVSAKIVTIISLPSLSHPLTVLQIFLADQPGRREKTKLIPRHKKSILIPGYLNLSISLLNTSISLFHTLGKKLPGPFCIMKLPIIRDKHSVDSIHGFDQLCPLLQSQGKAGGAKAVPVHG